MKIKPWKTLSSKYLIQDKWMTLRADKCETPDGIIVEPYYVQEPQDWAHVVAFNDNHEILLTEQYRHGMGKVCIELPCGAIEPGEDPEAAMKRELLEETGCEAKEIVALPPVSPNPARYANTIYAYVAFGTTQTKEQNLDETEDIAFRFWPLQEVMELIRNGEFWQSLHLASLMLAFDKAGLLSIKGIS